MKNENTAEIELYDLKWFDYRPLAPDGGTKVFVLEYVMAGRKYNDRLG